MSWSACEVTPQGHMVFGKTWLEEGGHWGLGFEVKVTIVLSDPWPSEMYPPLP